MEVNTPNNLLTGEKMVISKEERIGINRDKRPSVFIMNTVISLN